MAELNPKTINEFPEVTTLDGTELLPMSQGGSTKKAAVATVTEKAVDEAVADILPRFVIMQKQGTSATKTDGNHTGSFDITESGYRPVALAGISAGASNSAFVKMVFSQDRSAIEFNIRTIGTATVTPVVDILYIRESDGETT